MKTRHRDYENNSGPTPPSVAPPIERSKHDIEKVLARKVIAGRVHYKVSYIDGSESGWILANKVRGTKQLKQFLFQQEEKRAAIKKETKKEILPHSFGIDFILNVPVFEMVERKEGSESTVIEFIQNQVMSSVDINTEKQLFNTITDLFKFQPLSIPTR